MSQIKSFKLPSSFDIYNTEPNFTLDPISTTNIFVGSNNSGKSRFLRMLSIQNEYKVLIEGVDLSLINTEIQGIFNQLRSHLLQSKLRGANNISLEYIDNLKVLPDCLTLNLDSYAELRSIFISWKNFPEIKNWMDQANMSSDYPSRDKFRKAIISESVKALDILEKIPVYSEANIPKRVYIPVLRGLRPIDADHTDLYAIQINKDYFSNVISSSKTSPPEVFTGLTLYADIMKMLLGNNRQRRKIAEYQEFITKILFENKPVTLIPSLEEKAVIVKIGNEKERPIFHLGDGIQSAIIMSFLPFVREEPTFFFIEEPEIYLHPGLQRKILDFFAAKSEHTFFLTTHSNHFLDLTIDIKDVSIFTFRKQLSQEEETDEQTPTFIVESVEGGNSSSLELLGVRNSSVFLVNATIWVEGITDRWYLRKMLNSYMEYLKEDGSLSLSLEEDVHYSFVEYGGNNITHWSFLDKEEHPIKIDRLCAKALVIVDEDGDKKLARKDKLERFLGERLIVLPAREIENILPYNVIKEVILEYEKNPSLQLPDKPYSAYQHKYLGTFIEDRVFNGKSFSRRGGYKEGSGTIKSKPDFCSKALPKIRYQDLPPSTQEVIEKIYKFIKDQNS